MIADRQRRSRPGRSAVPTESACPPIRRHTCRRCPRGSTAPARPPKGFARTTASAADSRPSTDQRHAGLLGVGGQPIFGAIDQLAQRDALRARPGGGPVPAGRSSARFPPDGPAGRPRGGARRGTPAAGPRRGPSPRRAFRRRAERSSAGSAIRGSPPTRRRPGGRSAARRRQRSAATAAAAARTHAQAMASESTIGEGPPPKASTIPPGTSSAGSAASIRDWSPAGTSGMGRRSALGKRSATVVKSRCLTAGQSSRQPCTYWRPAAVIAPRKQQPPVEPERRHRPAVRGRCRHFADFGRRLRRNGHLPHRRVAILHRLAAHVIAEIEVVVRGELLLHAAVRRAVVESLLWPRGIIEDGHRFSRHRLTRQQGQEPAAVGHGPPLVEQLGRPRDPLGVDAAARGVPGTARPGPAAR